MLTISIQYFYYQILWKERKRKREGEGERERERETHNIAIMDKRRLFGTDKPRMLYIISQLLTVSIQYYQILWRDVKKGRERERERERKILDMHLHRSSKSTSFFRNKSSFGAGSMRFFWSIICLVWLETYDFHVSTMVNFSCVRACFCVCRHSKKIHSIIPCVPLVLIPCA